MPLAEEGWIDHPVTREVAREYLAPLRAGQIDTLVLGCTHYGVLRESIQSALAQSDVVLVDSAAEVAREVAAHLKPGADRRGDSRFYVSDIPARFREVGSRFLGRPLPEVVLVDQTDLPWFERQATDAGDATPSAEPPIAKVRSSV